MHTLSRRSWLKMASAGAAACLVNPHTRLALAQQQSPTAAIDVHAHMPLMKFGGPLAPRLSRAPDGADTLRRRLAEAVKEETFEGMAAVRIQDMDRWGVEKTVVMPIDLGMNDAETHWAEQEAVARTCKAHSDRFIPFVSIDPQRDNAVELLDKSVNELGMQGVKIHPLAGFAIDDEEVAYGFYERCVELGVPVLGHCRPVGLGERDKLSRPERYAAAAKDFPKLKLCLGHLGGGPWSKEALDAVEAYENAYGDISTMQSFALENPTEFAAILRRAMDGPARARVMYGSDWPTGRRHDYEFMSNLRNGLVIDGKPTLDAEEIELILRKNAENFLRRG